MRGTVWRFWQGVGVEGGETSWQVLGFRGGARIPFLTSTWQLPCCWWGGRRCVPWPCCRWGCGGLSLTPAVTAAAFDAAAAVTAAAARCPTRAPCATCCGQTRTTGAAGASARAAQATPLDRCVQASTLCCFHFVPTWVARGWGGGSMVVALACRTEQDCAPAHARSAPQPTPPGLQQSLGTCATSPTSATPATAASPPLP